MDTQEFYTDSESKWRWRRKASNGRIVGASSQGYVNKSDCIDNARRNGYKGQTLARVTIVTLAMLSKVF